MGITIGKANPFLLHVLPSLPEGLEVWKWWEKGLDFLFRDGFPKGKRKKLRLERFLREKKREERIYAYFSYFCVCFLKRRGVFICGKFWDGVLCNTPYLVV